MVTRARVGGTVGAWLPFVCRAWMTNVPWDLTYTDSGALDQSDEEFNAALDASIGSIFQASTT